MQSGGLRRSIVAVLGAGASWPLPQTPKLTAIVCELCVPISDFVGSVYYQKGVVVPLFRVLQQGRPDLQTFEALMAEAWEAKRLLERGGQVAPWLSHALPDLSVREASSLLATSLGQAAHRVGIELKRCTDTLERRQTLPAIVPVLDQIAKVGLTVVATLNYDDLAQKGDTRFYDGFASSGDQRAFDHEFALQATRTQNTLLWLHGSIHLNVEVPTPGLHATSCPEVGELFWEADADRALRGWVQGFRNDGISFPVVIATDKPRQLLRTPFLDYWHVLNRSLDSAATLLVIGYGGGDEHLNGILQDAVLRRGSDLRVVWCTCASSETEVLSVLYRVFPTLINPYCPREPVVVGKSLQQVVNPSPGIQLPKLWVDPDGVDDLRTNIGRLLGIIG